jgi:hypothetical protein
MTSTINALRAAYEPLRTLLFGDIGIFYTELGTPLEEVGRILTFKNSTDAIITISFDGVNDHEILFPNSFDKTDFTSNKAATQGGFLGIPANTQVWIKGAPGSGQVSLSVVYGSNH